MPRSELTQQEAVELFATEIIRPEVNFLLFPYFVLSWKEVRKLTKIEHQTIIKRKGAEVKISWTVSPNIEYGIPTPFDKEVKSAVDAIISRTKKPISNPLELPYISEIAKMIGLKPDKRGFYRGRVYNMIKEAFLRIVATTVHSEGTFYLKEKSLWLEKAFHLYDSVVFRGEKMPDGIIAETNYLWLNALYLDNINNDYVKPIDYTYFQNLKNYIAKRLYELLGVKFYGLRNKREQFFRIGYLNLCQLLPITPQKSFSLMNKNLKPAHDELIQKGFLSKVEYEKTKDGKSFNILYFPGERARKEMQGYWGIEILEEEIRPLEIEAPKEKTIREESSLNQQRSPQSYDRDLRSRELRSIEVHDEEEILSPMAQELINRGITKAVAIDFAEHLPEDYIREKIDLHDSKKELGEIMTNAAGWLREAIARDYQLSEEQLKKQAQLEQKKEQQVTLKEKAKEIQEQRLLEALADFPASEQWVQERVVEHVKVRDMTIKSIGGEHFTEAEIKELYLRYQAQIPQTKEEKRAWLMSNDSAYSLSAIISELKQEQQPSLQKATETAEEGYPFNSMEDVLVEVARQRAEFEANQKSENEN